MFQQIGYYRENKIVLKKKAQHSEQHLKKKRGKQRIKQNNNDIYNMTSEIQDANLVFNQFPPSHLIPINRLFCSNRNTAAATCPNGSGWLIGGSTGMQGFSSIIKR